LTDDPESRAHFSGARTRFLHHLLKDVELSTATLLIFSRDEVDIREGLQLFESAPPSALVIEYGIKESDTHNDVRAYARTIVKEKLPSHGDSVRESVASDLSLKARGMFLWIRLEKDRLRPSQTLSQLKMIVSTMPTGVHRLYLTFERSFRAISNLQEETDRNRAMDILRWILFAARPLTIYELAEALSLRDALEDTSSPEDVVTNFINKCYATDEIRTLCGSLITIQSSMCADTLSGITTRGGNSPPTVHFSHFSVKEFLLKKTYAAMEGNIQFKDAVLNHKLLAETCLAHLLFLVNLTRGLQPHAQAKGRCFSFLNYAAAYWPFHHRLQECRNDTSRISLDPVFGVGTLEVFRLNSF
jgi:hypothetical protein